jgi:hypothetical protein
MMKCVVPVIMAGIIAIVSARSTPSAFLSHKPARVEADEVTMCLLVIASSTDWSSRSSSRVTCNPPCPCTPDSSSSEPVSRSVSPVLLLVSLSESLEMLVLGVRLSSRGCSSEWLVAGRGFRAIKYGKEC